MSISQFHFRQRHLWHRSVVNCLRFEVAGRIHEAWGRLGLSRLLLEEVLTFLSEETLLLTAGHLVHINDCLIVNLLDVLCKCWLLLLWLCPDYCWVLPWPLTTDLILLVITRDRVFVLCWLLLKKLDSITLVAEVHGLSPRTPRDFAAVSFDPLNLFFVVYDRAASASSYRSFMGDLLFQLQDSIDELVIKLPLFIEISLKSFNFILLRNLISWLLQLSLEPPSHTRGGARNPAGLR